MIVLDTHSLFWLIEASPLLGRGAKLAADAALRADELAVSAFSFWELAMLTAKRRLKIDLPMEDLRRNVLVAGVTEIPVSGDIGIVAATLPYDRGDPADRIIAATAISLDATLMTADRRLLAWRGELKTQDARR